MSADSGIVTGHSGQSRQSVTFLRNDRSRSSGISGRDRPEYATCLVVRNATLNFLQAYSLGYPVGRIGLAYVGASLGLIVIILLLVTQQYRLCLAIGAVAVAFAPYYPLIPAYMFGSYMLLAFGAIEAARHASRRIISQRLSSRTLSRLER